MLSITYAQNCRTWGLGERIARFKVPKAWVIVEKIPRTAYGKVRRPELVRRWLEAHGGR